MSEARFPILALTIGNTATVCRSTRTARTASGPGAEARHELADSFWGERHGQLGDPFGHDWNVAQRHRDVPHDEIVVAAARAFGGG
jgi:uncharacterized glyoxalase superfamily protein PhnB